MQRALPIALLVAACHASPAKAPSLPPGDRTVTVDGAAIAIHVRGHGPVCLVEPGGPGLEWSYLRMPALEDHLTLVYIEPVGTGGSARPGKAELTRERWARDVEGVRAALGVDRVYLLGHSYGGFVAESYAIAHPEHLRGVILYSTSARSDDDFARAQEAGIASRSKQPWFADAMDAASHEDSATSDAALTEIFHREAPLMFADWTRRHAEFDALVAATHAYAPEGGDPPPFDLRAPLARVKVPALVIGGKEDVVIAIRFAEELHQLLAGSTLVELERSGHMGHLEEPDAFDRAVVAFVAAHP